MRIKKNVNEKKIILVGFSWKIQLVIPPSPHYNPLFNMKRIIILDEEKPTRHTPTL